MTDHGRKLSARRRIARVAISLAAAMAPVLTLTSCESLLEAEAPSRILEETLEQPSNAQVIVAGAVADFECAFSQYVAVMGTVADEFSDSQANAAIWDIDRRTNFPSTGLYSTGLCGGFGGVYTPVSIARYTLDNALRLLESWSDADVPGRTALIARAAAYSGYAHILLGEGFCSAAVDLGPELTPAQLFALAEEKFAQALAAAATAGNDSLKNLALGGRARARLNLGKRTEAAADAALVPNGFVFNARHSAASGRSENRVFRANNTNGTVTVDSTYRNVQFLGVADPRVPVSDAGRGGGLPSVRLWVQNKYTSLAAPIPIATWREALLIRAEVAGGQEAVSIINQLHARVGLPPFVSVSEPAIQAQVIEERRRELFLESHRLYDTIRFAIPLKPTAGSPFPNGGGTYGDNKCLPLPDVERLNNPSIPKP